MNKNDHGGMEIEFYKIFLFLFFFFSPSRKVYHFVKTLYLCTTDVSIFIHYQWEERRDRAAGPSYEAEIVISALLPRFVRNYRH